MSLISIMRREEDETILDPPLPPLAGRASEKLEWRSIAYYNCAVCNRVGADYIVNMSEKEEKIFLLLYVALVIIVF